MQRIKWISLIVVLLIAACQEEESSNVIPQEQVSVAPSSELPAVTLVEGSNLTAWFDQFSFFQGDNGASNMRLQGRVQNTGSSKPFIYSNLYQNIEGAWVEIATSGLYPTESEDGTANFDYSLELPQELGAVIDDGGGYKIATFIRPAHDQKAELAMKSFYAGNRKVNGPEAGTSPTTRTDCSGLKHSIDALRGNEFGFTIAGWVCRCGYDSNNINVYINYTDPFFGQFPSPKFRANLTSEQDVKDICKTNLDHRFSSTDSFNTLFLVLGSDPLRVDVFAEELDFFAPGNVTLLETQFCQYLGGVWFCTF